jgi:hypothetical protein
MTTLFGNHTIAELADLLRAKDPGIPDLEKQYNAFHPTWTLTDPTSDAAFSRDLGALKARYATATAGLHAVIDATSGFMANKTSAEPQYTRVWAALQKQSGVTSPGDYQELFTRLENAIQANEAARGLPPTKLYERPASSMQPRHDSDWAENVIRSAPPAPKMGQPIDTGWVSPPVSSSTPPATPPPTPPGEPWPWATALAVLLGIFGVGALLLGVGRSRAANITDGARPALPPRRNTVRAITVEKQS